MPNQPVKKKFDYEKYFSNELDDLLKYIRTEIAGEIPITSLTFDVFMMAAMEHEDCMLYRVVNSFLTSGSMEEIHDRLHSSLSMENIMPVEAGKRNALLPYSPGMVSLFMAANEIRESLSSPAITSDMVLLAFVSEGKDDRTKQLLAGYGITEKTVLEFVKKMKDTVSSISAMDENRFGNFLKNYLLGVDVGSGDSVSSITIVGTLDDFISTPDGGIDMAKKSKKPSDKSKKYHEIEFCENLIASAEKDPQPFFGRSAEIQQIAKVLGRKMKNNVLLVGEPGVGKTAIVNGLARQILGGTAPFTVKNSEIFNLNVTEIEAGTQYRGQFEQRVSALIKSLKSLKSPILLIDNAHLYLAGERDSNFDWLGGLEPIFTDRNIMVIMTTTPKGYHASIEKSPVMANKFQRVDVEQPSETECRDILKLTAKSLGDFHKVKYSDSIIDLSVTLAARYMTDRRLPSSAIDLLDEAGAIKKMAYYDSEKIKELRSKISELKKERADAVMKDDIEKVKECGEKIDAFGLGIAIETEELGKGLPFVLEDDLHRAVSEHTGIPVSKISTSERKRLSSIEKTLSEVIVGQDEAINAVARAIKRNKVGLAQPNRPILSAMCIGSTGCGKTLLAKTLAGEIFGDEKKYLVRFDMSEYADKTAVNKLIGASAGYVGYSEGGLLTEAVKNRKYAVILVDEIEKADEEVFNLFLQVLDEGFLTDNTGTKVDFKNTILILTSNVGAKRAANEKPIGFIPDNGAGTKDIITKELKNKFPPEFLNRLDEIVYFNTLTDENFKEIIRLELNKLVKKIDAIGCKMDYDDSVVDYLYVEIEPDKEYGARPITRAIRKNIENPITDILLEDDDTVGKEFSVRVQDGKICINGRTF